MDCLVNIEWHSHCVVHCYTVGYTQDTPTISNILCLSIRYKFPSHIWEWLTAQLVFTRCIYFSHFNTQYPSHSPAEERLCVHIWYGFACGLYLSWSKKTITNTLCPDTLVMQWRSQIPGNQRCLWCLQNLHLYAWEQELAYDVIAVASKVSAFAQPVHNIKARMYTHYFDFFMAIFMLFEGGGWQGCVNRWKSAFNCVTAKLFKLPRVWISHYNVALSCSLLGHTS